MTERIIQREVRRFFGNYEYILFNTFMFAWESDFFAISKSGYSVEVEIKCSRADFKKDFTHKIDKHRVFGSHKQPLMVEKVIVDHVIYGRDRGSCYVDENGKTQWARGSSIHIHCPADYLPNKFYYACPENLITVDEVPAYAGLIYIRETEKIRKGIYTGEPDTTYTVQEAYEVKKAPFLHKNIKNHQKSLLSKYYWKHKNDRVDVITLLNSIEHDFDLPQHHKEGIRRISEKFL
jgi:hypothetical protein